MKDGGIDTFSSQSVVYIYIYVCAWKGTCHVHRAEVVGMEPGGERARPWFAGGAHWHTGEYIPGTRTVVRGLGSKTDQLLTCSHPPLPYVLRAPDDAYDTQEEIGGV